MVFQGRWREGRLKFWRCRGGGIWPPANAWRCAAHLTVHAVAIALLVAPLLVSGASPARGQSAPDLDGPFSLDADEIEMRSGEQVYIARGNVRIEQEGRVLTAQRVFFNQETRQGVASGDVEVVEDGDTLVSDFLQFNVDTLRGTVFKGELISPESQYSMTGGEIRKVGEDRYTFRDARFSTCDCPKKESRDPWAVRASSAKAELGGYAVAKNNRFEVLGVPVFWLPWFVYPLKEKRTSGFLVPELSRSSRAGVQVGLPFFWALRDNMNLTLKPEYQSKRGFKPSAELEYVFGRESYGELYGTFVHDTGLDADDPKENFDRDRFGGTWTHLQDLPGGVRFQSDAVIASDNNVPFDFSDFGEFRLERYLHSNAFLWRHFGPADRFAALGGVRFADDLQSPDRDDRDDFLLQRLPEVKLSAMTGELPFVPGLLAGGELQYSYFQPTRDQEATLDSQTLVDGLFYDTGIDAISNGKERDGNGVRVPVGGIDVNGDDAITEGDGFFQEGEPLADRGHRLLVNPRLSYPLHWDFLRFVPELSYHGTYYHTKNRGTELRHMAAARGELSSTLRREIPWFFTTGTADHLLEPQLGYAFVSDTGQKNNPLLVPRTAVPQLRLRHIEIDNLIRDPADRIGETNSIFAGVSNRFLHPEKHTLLAEVSASTEYRFVDNEIGPVVLHGRATPGAGVQTRFHVVFEPEKTRFSDGLMHLSFASRAGHSVALRYRYVRQIPQVFEDFVFDGDRFDDFEDDFSRINQVSGSFYLKVSEQVALTYSGSFSFENSLSLRNLAGIEYISRCKCWAFRVEASHDRQRGFDVGFRYRLLGLGDRTGRPFAGTGSNPFVRD